MLEILLGIFALIIIAAGMVWISEEVSQYMRNENLQEVDELEVVFK